MSLVALGTLFDMRSVCLLDYLLSIDSSYIYYCNMSMIVGVNINMADNIIIGTIITARISKEPQHTSVYSLKRVKHNIVSKGVLG